MSENYDKNVPEDLVDWQYQFNGSWTSFEQNNKGDSAIIEKAYRAGNKTTTLNHGWSSSYKIDFRKKTSERQRGYGSTCKVRRWVKYTPMQLKKRARQQKIDSYHKKVGKKAAVAFLRRYYQNDQWNRQTLLQTDLGIPSMKDAEVDMRFFALLIACESYLSGMTEDNFFIGMSKLGNPKNAGELKSALESKISALKKDPRARREFFIDALMVVGCGKDNVVIESPRKRIDKSDGNAYEESSFIEYYGNDSTQWKDAPIMLQTSTRQIRALLDFCPEIGKKKIFDTMPEFRVLFPDFLSDACAGSSIGRIEWAQLFDYTKSSVKPEFKDFSEYDAPSKLSEFKDWVLKRRPKKKASGGGGGGGGGGDTDWLDDEDY